MNAEIEQWLDPRLTDSAGLQPAREIVEWAERNELPVWVRGAEIATTIPSLPGSDAWLAVSPHDALHIVGLGRRMRRPRFAPAARGRLLKRIDHEGFVQKSDGGSFALFRLAELAD